MIDDFISISRSYISIQEEEYVQNLALLIVPLARDEAEEWS